MYNIIPLVIILVCLGIIIIIVVRKFSVLANLDVENMPAEREAKFKEQIISNRLKRNFVKWSSRINRALLPVAQGIRNFFQWALARLTEMKREDKAVQMAPEDMEQQITRLFSEAEDLRKQNELSLAEKKFIEIIGLDSKNIKAFKELGQLYFEQKSFEEAKQTFEHILRLKEGDQEIFDNLAQIAKEKGDLNEARDEYLKSLEINRESAETYYNLALVYKGMENLEEAVQSIKKALKIEPNNPRYLDTMLEISIIIKDKVLANSAYNKLVKVNPENQKIKDFKKQIDDLE